MTEALNNNLPANVKVKKNRIGEKFGRLTVIEFYGRNNQGDALWKSRCDCGGILISCGGNLGAGRTKSCGCLQKESRKKLRLAARRDIVTNFWSKVDKSGDCWLWTDACNQTTGYGQFGPAGYRRFGAHKWAWILTHGEVPKGMWPLIKAWAEGGELQVRNSSKNACDRWSSQDEVVFNCEPESYRIKPEPKLRPWKPEEVPVGGLLRVKGCEDSRYLITYSGPDRMTAGAVLHYPTLENMSGTTENALELWEHSTDGGKTWKPCGIEE